MTRLSLLLPFLLLTACGERPATQPEDAWPWQITVLDPQHSRVFGITLGRSTLGGASASLGAGYKLALFEDPGGRLSLEVYYSEFTRGGLSGKLILVLDGSQADLAALRDRAAARQVLGSGNVRYTLSDADQLAVPSRTIVALDYIPYVNLDAETITGRFGPPAERIRLAAGREHWLYPDRGLDILLDPEGKELLQYVPPANFERLVRPLREAERAAAGRQGDI